MTNEFTYSHEQAFARDILIVAIAGGISRWALVHGYTIDSPRRSHGWSAEINNGFGHGRIPRSELCRPIALTADLGCDHIEGGCNCVGDMVYRDPCLHCAREGEIRDDHNGAAEAAHDHAWPGWREPPIVEQQPEPGTGKKQSAAMQRWIGGYDLCGEIEPEPLR